MVYRFSLLFSLPPSVYRFSLYTCPGIPALLIIRFRIHLAITRAAKLALKRYFKCLDGPTGAEYYFDPKTGMYCIFSMMTIETPIGDDPAKYNPPIFSLVSPQTFVLVYLLFPFIYSYV